MSLLLTGTLALGITGAALAAKPKHDAPDGLQAVKTRQLDRAWVNPEFNPSNYNSIAVEWGDFEYRPGKNRFDPRWDNQENYTMPERTRAKLEQDAVTAFTKQLNKLEGFKVVDSADADNNTLTVKLQLKRHC